MSEGSGDRIDRYVVVVHRDTEDGREGDWRQGKAGMVGRC